MNQLENAVLNFRSFIKNEELKKSFNTLADLVAVENKFNLQANLKVETVDEKTLNISDLEYLTDYETLTGHYETIDGEEYSYEERDERMEEIDDELTRLTEEQNEIDEDKEPEKFDEYSVKIGELESLRNKFDEAEYMEDEICWNTVYQYNGYVNHELAKSLGLGVLNNGLDGEDYMFLRGCGMDLSPIFVAYQALEFGHIDSDLAYKFREVDYFKHVVGEEVFNKIVKILGISECIETAKEEQEQRMKEFEEKLKKLTELRDSGADQATVSLLGLIALTQEMK